VLCTNNSLFWVKHLAIVVVARYKSAALAGNAHLAHHKRINIVFACRAQSNLMVCTKKIGNDLPIFSFIRT